MTSVIQQVTSNVSTSPVYKGSRWSKSGTYLAMGGASGATYIYKRSGTTLTLLSSALSGTALAGNIYDVDFSQNDTYFGVYGATQSGSSYTAFYKNNGNDTFTRLSTPATTVPPGSRALDAISFSPSSPLVAMAMNATPWLEIQTYNTSTDAFTKCTLAGTPPSVALSGVKFSPDGNYLAVVTASGIIVYQVSFNSSTSTVTLTPCTQSSGTVPGSGAFNVAWHPNSQYFAVFQNTAAASILVMKVTGTTTYAQLSATIPQLYTSTSNISGDWSSDGRRIVGRDGSANIYIWNFNSDETFTFDVSFAGVAAGSAANRVRLSPDGGSMLITAGDTTGTTFAQFYSDYNKNGVAENFPALSGQVNAVNQYPFWSQDGKYLFFSVRSASPGVYIYKRVGLSFTRLPVSAITGSLTWTDGRPGDFSRENRYVAFASQQANTLNVLKNNGDDTFTQVFNPTLPSAPNNVWFSKTQNILAVSLTSSPYIAFYKYNTSNDTFTALSLTGAVTALEAAPNAVQFSPDTNWLLASYSTTASYRLYQISSIDLTANTVTLASIAKPGSGEPTVQSYFGAFDPTSTYFCVSTATTNLGPIVYKISGGSYTKLTNQPAAPRTAGAIAVGAGWRANDKRFFYLSSESQARLYAFDFVSGADTFTSQITTDWPQLGGGGQALQPGPSGNFVAVTTNSAPYTTVWTAGNLAQVDAATFPVFGTPNSSAKFKSTITSVTRLAAASNIAASGGAQVKFSPDGNYLSYTASVTPFSRMFSRSGDTFTPLSNFSTGQPNVTTSKPEWFSDSTHLILLWLNGSNYWNQYLNSSGTFTSSNSYLGTQPNAVRLSPDGTLGIAVLSASPWVRIFNMNANSTVGTEYTITWSGGTPGSTINDVAISSDNKKIAFGFNNVVESTRIYDVTAINTSSATITLTKRAASSDQTATNTTTCLRFNPDNIHLAVATTSTTSGTAGVAVYNIPNTVGSAYSRVNLLVGATDTEAAKAVAWSADGTKLMAAFTSNFGVCDYSVASDRAGALVLPDISPTSPIVWGDLSADAGYVAVTSTASPTLTFYKVNLAQAVNATPILPAFTANASVKIIAEVTSSNLFPTFATNGRVNVKTTITGVETFPTFTANGAIGAYPKEYPEAISWKPNSVVQASTPVTFSEAAPDNPAAYGDEILPVFAINSHISVRINVDPNGEPLTYPTFATNGVVAVGLIKVNPNNEAFTYPAFAVNGTLFDKINVSGPVTFPAFDVRSTVKLMNEVTGNAQFPAFTANGEVLWATLTSDVDFPTFQTVGDVKVTYAVNGDEIFPVFTAEGSVEWITASGTETFPQFQTDGNINVPVAVEGVETFPTFIVNALSSIQQKLSGSPTFPIFQINGQVGASNHVDARTIFPKFQINGLVGNTIFVNPNDEAFTFPAFAANAELENFYKLTGNMSIKISMSGNMFRGKPHTLFHVIEN